MHTKTIIIAVTALITGTIIGLWIKRTPPPHTSEPLNSVSAENSEPSTWTCSMHPQIQQPKEGDCPICGMDLIPLQTNENQPENPRAMTMSESALALANIQTSRVIRQAPDHTIQLVGQLDRAETHIKSLTARFPARVDTLHIDSVGSLVKKGQALADIYSPELLSAQRELLAAHRRDPDGRLTQAAREKLLLWDLQNEQIDTLLEADQATEQFELRAPTDGIVVEKAIHEGDYVQTGQALYTIADLSQLWLNLEAYEKDLPWLQAGQTVRFTIESFPGEYFDGHIDFIEPELNARTRTIPVRVHVDNPDGRLRPGMFAQATVHATNTTAPAPLIIPASSVLRTGKRAVVYVELTGTEQPTFEGREVVLGPKAGDNYIVQRGLNENESVVTHGAFKIDSALQIQAKPSMMSMPSETAPTSPEQHRIWLELLPSYLKLQAALADDDLSNAQQIINNMMTVTGHSGEAAQLIHQMMPAQTLDAIRRPHFETLSNHIINAIEAHPERIEQTLYIMHCPMVYDDRPDAGASWLQDNDTLLNPYFGAMMLHCGATKETITND